MLWVFGEFPGINSVCPVYLHKKTLVVLLTRVLKVAPPGYRVAHRGYGIKYKVTKFLNS
jgi:hypothetical protein